ncbi:hypothetical protein ACFL0D_02090 [Thermoproteota archaeon]
MGFFQFDEIKRVRRQFGSSSLNSGGLYFIQNLAIDWTMKSEQSWSMEKNDVKVKTSYERCFKNILEQIYTVKIMFEVNDRGKKGIFVQEDDYKYIFPQEFKSLLKMNGKFDFLGWWKGNSDTWHIDEPLEKAEKFDDNMVLLRKR